MSRYSSIRPQRMIAALLPVGVVVLAGCSMTQNEMSMSGTYEGPPTEIGQGQARAFVTLDNQGKATTIGVRMTESALSGLPAEPPAMGEWEYSLTLPSQAQGTGYDHIAVDWNPHGHVPKGVYDVPHFDFHFYLIDAKAQDAITASGKDIAVAHKQPPKGEMPAGYVLPPGTEVPKMGAHAVDPAGPEFNHKGFTRTFIFGFYDAKMIFMEPMVTLAYLKTHPEVYGPVKQPQIYARHFDYPTLYGVHYDKGAKRFEITLDNLESR